MRIEPVDIKATRKKNLEQAVKIAGDMTRLAEVADTSLSYISQCLSDTIDKSLGDKMARRIEAGLGLEEGWMDQNHDVTVSADPVINDVALLINQLNPDERADLQELAYLMLRKRILADKYH